ncbi:MAG: DNA-processing protein DprA [Actinomycetia bacterium]|nr:DNA-processing protein DprA [Actinomycetes bacterium]
MSSPTGDYPQYQQLELLPGEAGYPALLLQLDKPPQRLYLIGQPELLQQHALAIVGSRQASPYGLSCAQRFGKRATFQGLTVVSGGAIGCDQAAHQGALSLQGPCIVVLGCGADVVYPLRARQLLEQILAAGGLIVSEAPWGAPPERWAFVRRNRVIAGLAAATLIIEAGLPSGTFSTADATLALGRELLVVPGSILSRQSAGCNQLIAQGAWPIIDDDSFDAALASIYPWLPPPATNQPTAGSRHQARSPTEALAFDEENEAPPARSAAEVALERLRLMPARPDELIGCCGQDIVEVIRCLSTLEMQNQVVRLLDGRFATRLTVTGEIAGAQTTDSDDSWRRSGGQRSRLAAGRAGSGSAVTGDAAAAVHSGP